MAGVRLLYFAAIDVSTSSVSIDSIGSACGRSAKRLVPLVLPDVDEIDLTCFGRTTLDVSPNSVRFAELVVLSLSSSTSISCTFRVRD